MLTRKLPYFKANQKIYKNSLGISFMIKGELNPKTDFLLFEHLGIVEQLHEVF